MKTKKYINDDFDKYLYYQWAVQSPEPDIQFALTMYGKLFHKSLNARELKTLPLHFREDFCGTGLLSATWLSQSAEFSAEGFDIDYEPIEWGKKNNFKGVFCADKRMNFICEDVRKPSDKSPHIRVAQNFSYCVFKTRQQMREYLSSCYQDLAEQGVFIMDVHGGAESFMDLQEKTKIDGQGFTYYWDQVSYSPVTGEAVRRIHFKREGEKKRKNVFQYDWRMWTLPELIDIMKDVGFKHVNVYWEGTNKDGITGDGIFKKTRLGTNDLSWVGYIIAFN